MISIGDTKCFIMTIRKLVSQGWIYQQITLQPKYKIFWVSSREYQNFLWTSYVETIKKVGFTKLHFFSLANHEDTRVISLQNWSNDTSSARKVAIQNSWFVQNLSFLKVLSYDINSREQNFGHHIQKISKFTVFIDFVKIDFL